MENFGKVFEQTTGYSPFPWQDDLYWRYFSQGKFPPSCNLPTGLGKTSVVAIWLIALANQPEKVPRRLVYVVNRRTVVDQTTNEVEKVRANLRSAGLFEPLARLCASPVEDDDAPLAISTLRGQFADNREWSADPSRPAVIIGTVDMIGSRLLFSGYGVGFKTKPLHAGFLGQDVLLVHDEAHLEPAFQELVIAIEKEQKRCKEFGKFHVMELSATSRSGDEVFGLTEKEKNGKVEEVRKRIEASKTIRLHPIDDEKKNLADKIAELALTFKDSKCAVLVFVRKIEDVEKVVAKLGKEKQEVQQLTGTLRGLERDQLVNNPTFRHFLPKAEPRDKTAFLVCTSAGEVGVNLTADHLICDLSTFDSMAQRFGRVNRFGERNDTEIHIVYPTGFDAEDELDKRRGRTLVLLRQLNGDGSPKALGELDFKDRVAAFAPPPTILSTSDILFDSWALTTIREKLPGRPPVEPYLHGLSEWQPPETHVAWREEVGVITGDLLKQYNPEDLLEDYPLKPHELLRDKSSRVFERLMDLKANPDTPVWLVSNDDTVEPTTLGKLIDAEEDELNHKMVLLPPSAGGLKNGMLASDSETANDVADEWRNDKNQQRRMRVWDDDPVPTSVRLIRTIDTKPNADEEEEDAVAIGRRYWHWYELPKSADNEGSKSARRAVLLDVHTGDVVRNAMLIVQRLPLSDELRQAVILTARFHDIGKRRRLFQRILGNLNPDMLLAKSAKPFRANESFRHEFASLLDVEREADFQKLSDDMKDLVLHLIAAHHGRGRPHFPADEVFDPEPKGKDMGSIAAEVPRRFARLQRKYGRWGLAYLESLLRAADYVASATPSATLGGQA